MTRLLAGLAAAAALAAIPAHAADDPTRRGFDPDPARLALSLDGGFAVETAGTEPRGARSVAAVLDLASGLLSLELGNERDALIARRLSLHLLAGWSFGPVEVAAHLPIAAYQDADFSLLERQGVSGPLVAPVSSSALGDLRLGAKVPVLDAARWPVGLAAMIDLRLPTGDGGSGSTRSSATSSAAPASTRSSSFTTASPTASARRWTSHRRARSGAGRRSAS
jgi:OmpA-OmpF porin, OOP family